MFCGVKLLDLRRKRMLCWKVFFCYDPAPEGSSLYRKKNFREYGLSDVACFLPFGFGKGWGYV